MTSALQIARSGLDALDHNVTRLAEDHANAKRFADLVRDIPGVRIAQPKVETNIVFLDVSGSGRDATEISAEAQKRGARIGAGSKTMMRAVTHLDVSAADIDVAARIFRDAVTARA